jgi:hypothetical protein
VRADNPEAAMQRAQLLCWLDFVLALDVLPAFLSVCKVKDVWHFTDVVVE